MNKKRKLRVGTVLFVLLLLVGLGIMLYPTASNIYTGLQTRRELNQYAEVVQAEKTDYSALWAAAEEYNRYLLEKEVQFWMEDGEEEYVSTLLNPLGTGMMGQIEIPKINVNLPIYQGTDEKELQSGAGYWPGTSLPTGGESTHCVITAHTGLVKSKFFTDLDQLEIGDIFILHILDRDMTYEVDQILITEPDDVSAFHITEGEDYVTLYTCYPYGVNTHRLLVRGHRVELTDEELAAATASSFPWWVLAIPAVLLPAAFLFIKKKRKSADKHPADKHPADKHPADKHPTDKHPTDKRTTDKRTTDKRPKRRKDKNQKKNKHTAVEHNMV